MIKTATTPVINLDGPNGKSFILLGYAAIYAEELGLDKKSILSEMTLSTYGGMIQTFEKHFGHYVILETNNKNLLDALNVKTFKL